MNEYEHELKPLNLTGEDDSIFGKAKRFFTWNWIFDKWYEKALLTALIILGGWKALELLFL